MTLEQIPSFGAFFGEKSSIEDAKKIRLAVEKTAKPVAVVADLEQLKELVAEAVGSEPAVTDGSDWREWRGSGGTLIVADADSPAAIGARHAAKEAWTFRESVWDGPKVFLQVSEYPSPARSLWTVPGCVLSTAKRRDDIAAKLEAVEGSSSFKKSLELLSEGVGADEMVTPDVAKEHVRRAIERSRSGRPNNIILIGETGVGKSEIVLEACREAGVSMAYFNVPQMDEMIQLLGIPFEVTEEIVKGSKKGVPIDPKLVQAAGSEKEARTYLAFIREKRVMEAEVIFWDELSGASDSRKYNAMLPVLRDKLVNGTPLEHYLCSIAAMNPDGYAGVDISNLDDRLLRRFARKLWVRPNPNVAYFVRKGIKQKTAKGLIEWYYKDMDEDVRRYFSPYYLEEIGHSWDEDPDVEWSIKMIGPGRIRPDHPENIPYSKLIARLTERGVVDLERIKADPEIIGKKTGYGVQMVADAIEDLSGDERLKIPGRVFEKLGKEQVERLLFNNNIVSVFTANNQQKEKEAIKAAAKGDKDAKFWVGLIADLRDRGLIKIPAPE